MNSRYIAYTLPLLGLFSGCASMLDKGTDAITIQASNHKSVTVEVEENGYLQRRKMPFVLTGNHNKTGSIKITNIDEWNVIIGVNM